MEDEEEWLTVIFKYAMASDLDLIINYIKTVNWGIRKTSEP